MSKTRDFRGPRRRGFDDDMPFSYEMPSSRPPRQFGGGGPMTPSGPVVDATVKWFNPDKGFGFVALSGGGDDAFLHAAVLQSAGHDSVAPGAKLRVQVGQGAKGAQVTKVLEVDASTAVEQAPRSGFRGAPRPPRRAVDPSTAVELSGTVKWFNGDKGFGFVATGDGGKDVFVHISVLTSAGLPALAEGQRVSMRVVDTPKGREAVSIALAG